MSKNSALSINTSKLNKIYTSNLDLIFKNSILAVLTVFSFGSFSPRGQIDKRLKSLERCQSLEEIQRLFESADFESVVRLLQPTLNYGSRSKTLEFVSSAPERPAQLMLLQVRYATPTSSEPIYFLKMHDG